MSAVVLQMVCVAGLLGLAVLAIVLSRARIATAVIYSATLVGLPRSHWPGRSAGCLAAPLMPPT